MNIDKITGTIERAGGLFGSAQMISNLISQSLQDDTPAGTYEIFYRENDEEGPYLHRRDDDFLRSPEWQCREAVGIIVHPDGYVLVPVGCGVHGVILEIDFQGGLRQSYPDDIPSNTLWGDGEPDIQARRKVILLCNRK
jgi:hypothetical protein